MYEKILLNGCWTLKSKEICVPATVPGYVHPALEKAGVLEDIFWRDNAEKCQLQKKRQRMIFILCPFKFYSQTA